MKEMFLLVDFNNSSMLLSVITNAAGERGDFYHVWNCRALSQG